MTIWVNAIQSGQPEPLPFGHSVTAARAIFAVLKSLSEGQFSSVE